LIYRLDPIHGVANGELYATPIRDEPLVPVNLFFDDSDNLVVVCYDGNGQTSPRITWLPPMGLRLTPREHRIHPRRLPDRRIP
jgi:hypothetical protein